MTKRKKRNKLVVDWITREDILSSYFVPEEREKVFKEGYKEGYEEGIKIQCILNLYHNGASKDLILKSFNISEKEFNNILKKYDTD